MHLLLTRNLWLMISALRHRKFIQAFTCCRSLATVDPTTIVAPPKPPKPPVSELNPTPGTVLDSRILSNLEASNSLVDLSSIVSQYLQHSGRVLDISLPYESRPAAHRKVKFDEDHGDDVAVIAHCIRAGGEHKITISSGFALDSPGQKKGESLILTCAHTLEEARTRTSWWINI
jgi:hypothetical protein